MGYPNNHLVYPKNVLAPKQINVDDYESTLYEFRFSGIHDLYNYLISNPKVNDIVWSDGELSSQSPKTSFYGKPYDEALEDLLKDIDPGYKEFLRIERGVNAGQGTIHKYETVPSVAGGHINVAYYTAGSPICYQTTRAIHRPKFVTMDVALSYSHTTSKQQVFNRAIIITNIAKALEQAGYILNINTFVLIEECNEVFKVIFNIKNYGGIISYPALYKSLCNVEFFRRLCFHLLETSNVTEPYWANTYGRNCSKEYAKKILKLGDKDLYFGQANDMSIWGDDLSDDFENAIDYLNLKKIIDVEKAKKDFKEKVKVLKK